MSTSKALASARTQALIGMEAIFIIGNLISETNDESFAFLSQGRSCQTLTRYCGKCGNKRGTRQSLVIQTNSGGKEESQGCCK